MWRLPVKDIRLNQKLDSIRPFLPIEKERDMRVVGIDPGTHSFDLFGMEDNKDVIIDESIKSEDILKKPYILIRKLEALTQLNIIVGPSGYGIPLKSIEAVSYTHLTLPTICSV